MNPSSLGDTGIDEILVSLVLPVFNTPIELLERAVGSALEQTHGRVEVVIVDDGSGTETARFLDELAERDPRIVVIHRRNGGVSAARNTGVDNARGRYVGFLDADDHLLPSFVAQALRTAIADEADAVFGGIRVLHRGGETTWRTEGTVSGAPVVCAADGLVDACVRALADAPAVDGLTDVRSVTNVVAALYRTEVARTCTFPEGVEQGEDRLYNLAFLARSGRAVFCADIWYCYDGTHDQGATRQITPRTADALVRTIRAFAEVAFAPPVLDTSSATAGSQIAQAAAQGVLGYLKVLTGVLSLAPGRRGSGAALLRRLLAEPPVHAALALAGARGWRDRVFVVAARGRRPRVLLLLGGVWARGGGLGMAVASSDGGGTGHV